jgi:cation transport ATPase
MPLVKTSFDKVPRHENVDAPTLVKAPGDVNPVERETPPDHDDDHEDHSHGFDWLEAARIAFVALAAVAAWFKLWEPFSAVSVIGVVGLLVGGWPILKEAFENILERRMTMELSMTITVVAAAAIGQFFTALIITLFVLVAEVLEGLTVGRGCKAIRDLLEFLPREVSVRRRRDQRYFRRRAADRRCHSGCLSTGAGPADQRARAF